MTTALFLLPAVLLFSVFVLYPMLTAFSYSFFSWQGTTRAGWAWFANFTTLFTEAPFKTDLPRALGHNLLLFAGAMVFQNTIGLTIASFLYRRKRFKKLFQTLYTLPYLVSPLVIGYLWSLLLSPLFGPINELLRLVGLDSLAQPWLGQPSTALWAIVLVTAWQWLGFPILLYGAALGGIPEELNEAASLDGASGWQRFRTITLPLLTSSIGIVTILTFIGAMEALALPYAMGGSSGSPAGATDVLSLIFYRTAFESGATNGIGLSSALATLLFLFIFGIAMVFTTMIRRKERTLS
ncbi:carbohydrate ABC transporter permease [Arthrobacter zhaoguopingii]|uniref:carbohydrate ABC transporter permease n=1 Tax=Arthrobacter zhaoguopingii TaxID=2681491 RepID=UPI0013596ACE|nr:sugar ABC transporter permease [Arthrobacter zhaoguopingii]